jgi:hypothetical protein
MELALQLIVLEELGTEIFGFLAKEKSFGNMPVQKVVNETGTPIDCFGGTRP